MFGAQVSSRVTPVKARRDGGLYDNADVMKNIGAVVGVIYLQRQKLSARGYTVPVYIYIYVAAERGASSRKSSDVSRTDPFLSVRPSHLQHRGQSPCSVPSKGS